MAGVAPAPERLRRATRAVYAVFIALGFAFASWAARIPQVRDQLRVSPAELGLVLLAVAVGSLVAMPLAGLVVTKLGAARTVAVMSLIVATGLAVTAIGYQFGVLPVVAGLFLLGFGNGTWDVAMNVQAALVEQRLGWPIMSRFHAGYSLGTVAGAIVGSLMVGLHVGVSVHLLAVALGVGALVPTATRGFIAPEPALAEVTPQVAGRHGDSVAPGTPIPPAVHRNPLKAWTEPRTLTIGVFVLCMAFTEGTGTDWLGVAMIDGYHTAAVVGSLTFAVFVAAMTAGRWFGPGLLDRYGRVPVLQVSALTAFVGLLVVVFSGVLGIAIAGTVLWGLGTALGFPVGMSAAGDDPLHSAGRVSVVASIGYAAFLTGPPLIGYLGDHVGVLRALTVAAGLLALAAVLAEACREPAGQHGARSDLVMTEHPT